MSINVVFMGTPRYAETILNGLIDADDIEVSLVVTRPDKPAGRKRVLTPPPVKTCAQKAGIEAIQPDSLKDESALQAIKAVKPDFIVVAAFGQLLPETVLDIAPCINLHASLLPKYRGASPVHQALLNGDKITGVTSMLMDEGLDTGMILEKIFFEIPPSMRLNALSEQLARDAAGLTLSTLRNFDQIIPEPQNENEASYCKKIKKSDGEVDFENAYEIYNRYRAFEGWPGIFTSSGVKLEEVEPIEGMTASKKGEILSIESEAIIVGCAQGALRIGTLQPPSKKAMKAKSYCVGRRLKVGDILL